MKRHPPSDVICGDIKLLPSAFVPGLSGGKYLALTCVRKPDHPEPDYPSLHMCGEQTWPVEEPANLHYGDCAVWTGDDPCDCSAAVDLEPCS